jgi:hypothetical protein
MDLKEQKWKKETTKEKGLKTSSPLHNRAQPCQHCVATMLHYFFSI